MMLEKYFPFKNKELSIPFRKEIVCISINARGLIKELDYLGNKIE